MLSTKFYTEEQINEMRNFLKYEGWRKDADLPTNWMYKQNSADHKTPVVLVTPEAEVLESMKSGFDIIKAIYEDEDVNNMQRFMRRHYRGYLKQEPEDKTVEMQKNDAQYKTSDKGQKSGVKSNVKMELMEPEYKPAFDSKELDSILSNGNFTSSVIEQIKSEKPKKPNPKDVDMAELQSIFGEFKFKSNIREQILLKMKNVDINLNGIAFQESRKRKQEKLEGDVRRVKMRNL